MDKKCYICQSTTSFFISQQGFTFNKCKNCSLFFVDPMPTDQELSRVYSPTTNYQSNKIRKDYKKEKNLKFIKIFDKLRKYELPNQKVLDVGASDGEFLYYAKNNGFEPFGVEPNKTTADLANKNNLNVFNGFLSDCNFSKNSFGLLRLGDVLEHSNNPQKLINECQSFLVSGGLLVVSIPNMDSNWVRSTYLLKKIFSIPWSILEPPHHLLYFRENNLDLFMDKEGFKKITSWYDRPPTLKYELGNTHLFGKFNKQKNLTNFLQFFFGFSLYTILYSLDYIITPLKKKDYSMVCIYKKNA
ncbi:MAG: methyltransferase domain-containing protein [Minisyncoccia bacterium]